jgi:hypothetical protein
MSPTTSSPFAIAIASTATPMIAAAIHRSRRLV